MKAYKGFDKNFQCRGFQYEVGKIYTHRHDLAWYEPGFHACTNPLDVLVYYPYDGTTRYAEVELDGEILSGRTNSKKCAERITIRRELTLKELTESAHEAVGSVNYSPATTIANNSPAATLGDNSPTVTTGSYSPATTAGCDSPVVTTGRVSSAATLGRHSPAVTTDDYSYVATIGLASHAVAAGYESRACVKNLGSIACSLGRGGWVMGHEPDTILIAVEYIAHRPLRAVTGVVGEGGIKPDTWYTAKNGKLVEETR